jgi:hypothetical protein
LPCRTFRSTAASLYREPPGRLINSRHFFWSPVYRFTDLGLETADLGRVFIGIVDESSDYRSENSFIGFGDDRINLILNHLVMSDINFSLDGL